MRDLAFCQNEALVYGRSYSTAPADSAGRAIALGWINSAAESSRENKIIKTCMIAKGYKTVDKDSPLFSNNQSVSSWNPPAHQDTALNDIMLGHWLYVVTNTDSGITGHIEYYFMPHNRYILSVTENSLVNLGSGTNGTDVGRYYASGNKLVTWCDTDDKPETYTYSITDHQLTIMMLGMNLAFHRTGEVSNADNKTGISIIGHWESIAFKGKGVGDGVEKMQLDFLPNNQCIGTTKQNGKTYINKGQYTVKDNVIVFADPNTAPETAGYSLVGDKLVLTYRAGDAEVTLQRARTNTR